LHDQPGQVRVPRLHRGERRAVARAADTRGGGFVHAELPTVPARLQAARVRREGSAVIALSEYGETPGNLGGHLLRRDLGDGRTEVVTLSFWESMDAVRRF